MSRIMLLTITIVAITLSISASAESLWTAETAKSACVDKRASKVGDVVTVVIVESATSTSSASTDAKKDSSTKIGPGVGPIISNIPALSYSGGDGLKASGATTRTSKFVARMTATITKVDANGNLVLEGTRCVQTNKEQEQIKLSGTVRQQDIASDNTVLSTCLADAKITHMGNGPVGSRQREGIISRILGLLF